MANILLDRFVRAFPKQFLTHLMERQQPIYQQSIALAFNESWTRAEAMNTMPYIRRALWESEFRKTALACGLKAYDTAHAGDNCTCVMVKADGLIVTAHHVDGPGEFVRDAESRKQNAGINDWLPEHIDERLLLQPLPKLGRKPIYLNLLHGGPFVTSAVGVVTVDATSCFLRIAIPDDDSKKYLYNWSAQEVLLAYATAPAAAAVPQAVEDKAQPHKKAQLRPKRYSAGKTE